MTKKNKKSSVQNKIRTLDFYIYRIYYFICSKEKGWFIVFDEYPEVLSVKNTAKALGVSRKVVYLLVRDGEIGYKRVRSQIFIPKICLEAFMGTAITAIHSGGISDASERS